MAWSSPKNSGRRTRTTRTPAGPIYYDSKHSVAILLQCNGSAWLRVIPWCILNAAFTAALTALETRYDLPLALPGESSSLGHDFTGLVLSFLLVHRIGWALRRYSRYQESLGTVLRDVRGLTQKAIVFSRRNKNNDTSAKEWRSEIAYRSLLMARMTTANAEFPVAQIPAHEVAELDGPELQFCTPDRDFLHHAEIPYSKGIHSLLRMPWKIAELIRETICGQEERLVKPMSTDHEMNLLATVDSILAGYHGIQNLMLTPVPFPLVQMTLTLTMVYVFTLPLVFLKDDAQRSLLGDCSRVFFATYCFLGLAFVAQDLDDPFGCGPNDFDAAGCFGFALDDVVTMIHDADGLEWADALRYKCNPNPSRAVHDEMVGAMTGEREGLLPKHKHGGGDDNRPWKHAPVPDWMA